MAKSDLGFVSLRGRLAGNGVATGVFVELPSPEAVEIAGLAGWDYAVIDCEHGPITASMLPSLVRAGAAASIPTIVRVAHNEPSAIQHALDCGASGVQIPQIASRGAAEAAVSAARFHPAGCRGFNPFVRAAGFSSQPVAEFLDRSNREVTVVLQVESAAGIQAAGEILEVKGFDVLFLGPYDLSQSLGIPGETGHPKIFEAGARIVERAQAAGVAVGVFTRSAEEACRWLEAGVRYLSYSVDTVLLLEAMRQAVRSIRG